MNDNEKQNNNTSQQQHKLLKKYFISGLLYSSVLLSCSSTNDANFNNNNHKEISKENINMQIYNEKKKTLSEEDYFDLWNYYANLLERYQHVSEEYIISSLVHGLSNYCVQTQNMSYEIQNLLNQLNHNLQKTNVPKSLLQSEIKHSHQIYDKVTLQNINHNNFIGSIKKELLNISDELELYYPYLEQKDVIHLFSYFNTQLFKNLNNYNLTQPISANYINLTKKSLQNETYLFPLKQKLLNLPIIKTKEQ